MALILGIDVGGTNTDAVLLDPTLGTIRMAAKNPTTPGDLAEGIRAVLASLERTALPQVGLVSISTTLATNSILEDRGSPVGLLLIGYDENDLTEGGLERRLPVAGLRFVQGGHDCKGSERHPLDTEAARQAVLDLRGQVAAFAVSGYFSIMNSDHERQVRQIVSDLTHLPVVCGFELTNRLDAIKRVTTAVLNARLLSITQALLEAVKAALSEQEIKGPLMVVKGDGSLMHERVARQFPLEMVLSGPAASTIGACFLSGEGDAIVVDMGGTSTDLALLDNGYPWRNPAGAVVGGWRTSLEALDVWSIALGGDSLLEVGPGHDFKLGPGRAIPLCRLAEQWPGVVPELQAARQRTTAGDGNGALEYLVAMAPAEAGLLAGLGRGPRKVADLAGVEWERLEETGVVCRAGLTPSDVFWSPEMGGSGPAAREGVLTTARSLGCTVSNLEQIVRERISDTLTSQILDRLGVARGLEGPGQAPRAPASLLGQMSEPGQSAVPEGQGSAARPLVAVGAPAHLFLPQVAERLHTRCIIPAHAEVGSAVGAAVASVSKTVEVLVQPFVQGGGTVYYLVHTPQGREQFTSLSTAVARAETVAAESARKAVYHSGGQNVNVTMDRRELPLGTMSEVTVRAQAVGRPHLSAL